MNKIYFKTKKFLQDNSNIIITRSDKGNVTVALYKNDYHNDVMQLLGDKNFYIKLQKDPNK